MDADEITEFEPATTRDRTVENMIAAVASIESQIEDLIEHRTGRGGGCTAEDVLRLVQTVRKTYETMLPK